MGLALRCTIQTYLALRFLAGSFPPPSFCPSFLLAIRPLVARVSPIRLLRHAAGLSRYSHGQNILEHFGSLHSCLVRSALTDPVRKRKKPVGQPTRRAVTDMNAYAQQFRSILPRASCRHVCMSDHTFLHESLLLLCVNSSRYITYPNRLKPNRNKKAS